MGSLVSGIALSAKKFTRTKAEPVRLCWHIRNWMIPSFHSSAQEIVCGSKTQHSCEECKKTHFLRGQPLKHQSSGPQELTDLKHTRTHTHAHSANIDQHHHNVGSSRACLTTLPFTFPRSSHLSQQSSQIFPNTSPSLSAPVLSPP